MVIFSPNTHPCMEYLPFTIKNHPYVGIYTIHGMVWVRCLGVLKHRNAIRFRLPFSEGGPGSLLLQRSAMSIPLFTGFYVHLPYPSNHYHGSVDDGTSPILVCFSNHRETSNYGRVGTCHPQTDLRLGFVEFLYGFDQEGNHHLGNASYLFQPHSP